MVLTATHNHTYTWSPRDIAPCDGNLSEDDIFNRKVDWNADGIVNNYEFAMFSYVWLIHDPEDPAVVADPNYTDAETLAEWQEKWNDIYNLDGSVGTSQYVIDAGDLIVLAGEWLDVPCWMQSLLDKFDDDMAMAMGGESMMMMPMGFMSMAYEPEPEPAPEPVERSIAETVTFVEGIYDIIEYLDTSIEEDHENAENIYGMKTFLEGVLQDLQAER